MMAPSLLHLPDGGLAALGSGGSNRIRTALLQVICNLVDHGLAPAEAVAAPRMHVERGLAHLEPGFGPEAITAAEAAAGRAKLWPERNMFFGGVHLVHRTGQGRLSAAGDPRRAGHGATL
jgi:gamma-glutamyltranspeptidase/glutathione hydrolase